MSKACSAFGTRLFFYDAERRSVQYCNIVLPCTLDKNLDSMIDSAVYIDCVCIFCVAAEKFQMDHLNEIAKKKPTEIMITMRSVDKLSRSTEQPVIYNE